MLFEKQKELLQKHKDLEKKKIGEDKYNKDLITTQQTDILEEIVVPMMKLRKEYFETSYNFVLGEKRQEAKTELQKKYKDRNVVLPF